MEDGACTCELLPQVVLHSRARPFCQVQLCAREHTWQRKHVQQSCVLSQEAILFLQRLATLARSGYKGPVQQKWEATFLDMIHQLCTSSNLPQVTAAHAAHMPDVLISDPPRTAKSLTGCVQGPQPCLC